MESDNIIILYVVFVLGISPFILAYFFANTRQEDEWDEWDEWDA